MYNTQNIINYVRTGLFASRLCTLGYGFRLHELFSRKIGCIFKWDIVCLFVCFFLGGGRGCSLTSYSAIFQIKSGGTAVKFRKVLVVFAIIIVRTLTADNMFDS